MQVRQLFQKGQIVIPQRLRPVLLRCLCAELDQDLAGTIGGEGSLILRRGSLGVCDILG